MPVPLIAVAVGGFSLKAVGLPAILLGLGAVAVGIGASYGLARVGEGAGRMLTNSDLDQLARLVTIREAKRRRLAGPSAGDLLLGNG